MPSVKASAAQVRQLAADFLNEARKTGAAATQQVAKPKVIEDLADGATRAGQAVAVMFLPFVIVVSFTILLVINNVMANVLGGGLISGEQLTITAFLVTFLTLGLLIIVAWGWFQFVRTAGFGAFKL